SPRLHCRRRARRSGRRRPAELSAGAADRGVLRLCHHAEADRDGRLSVHRQSRLQRRPRASLDLLRAAARRVLESCFDALSSREPVSTSLENALNLTLSVRTSRPAPTPKLVQSVHLVYQTTTRPVRAGDKARRTT